MNILKTIKDWFIKKTTKSKIKYAYNAVDASGKMVDGTGEADNLQHASEIIRSKGEFPTSLREIKNVR